MLFPTRTVLQIASSVVVIAILQSLVPLSLIHWQYVLQRLYYVPIVLAGLFCGWRGGLAIAMICSVGYGIGINLENTPNYDLLDDLLELLVFVLVGSITGILADRQKSTAEELRRVYQELQENFERMKRAERLSAIGQLSAGLAHEIRNPLASIEGAARVVQKQPDDAERRHEFLDIIQKECRRLNGLLTNFLNFAKPRELHLEQVSLPSLCDSVITLAATSVEAQAIQFRKEIDSDLPLLQCDAAQMKQVLLNLVLNAVQAMPKGGEVILAAHRGAKGVQMEVRDQGQGIAPAQRERIFDPFFTTKPAGTGLGLSVAYQIVEQHKGELRVESSNENGTVFSISLPVWKEKEHDK